MQEVEERSRANSLKAIFESNRKKLSAARAEVREVRRTAKQSLALKHEVARPGQLLAEAGARKRSKVVSLRMKNASLKTAMKVLKGRGGERQASFEQVVDVRAQEREEAAGAIEARPTLEEVAEDACSCCVANGSHQDHRDQKRRIVRRGCDCPGSPSEAAVSQHRIRVWTHVLHERVHAALAPRPGAFAGNAGQRAGCCPCSSRFGTRSSRTGVCAMPMHPGLEGGPEIAPGSGHRSAVTQPSPSRSAEVAAKLFADAPMYPVCGRYNPCKKLARLWSFIILCCCRAHCRRDFPDCAGRSWRGGRTNGSIAEVCRLNTARLPCFRRRSRRRGRCRRPRSLFAEAPRLPKAAPEGRPLRSTIACSSTMDNNFGERAVRGPGQRAEARLRFRQHGRLSCTRHGREERPRRSALAPARRTAARRSVALVAVSPERRRRFAAPP